MTLSSFLIIVCALAISALAKETNEAAAITDAKKSEDTKTFYDQRQTGKYNVHVNIKDVQFFSLSDSLGSIGGDYEYGDYGSYDLPETDSEYDSSHLTVNPIFAFLGSQTKPKPTTTTPAPATTSAPTISDNNIAASTENVTVAINSTEAVDKSESSTEAVVTTVKQELETTVKEEAQAAAASTTTTKPALKPLKVDDDNIEYDEIPVEVQYYRHHQRLPVAASLLQQQQHNKRLRRPSVQILNGRNNNHNVKIIDSDQLQLAGAPSSATVVKICGRGEFRDSHGRCRLRQIHGRNGGSPPGLRRRVFNVLSSLLPKSK